MTHRICVLGNSHIACLRPPWDDLKAVYPGIDVEFFGAPGLRMANLKVHEGLVTGDQDLIDHFDRLGMRRGFRVEDFDSFVIVGCQIALFRMMSADLTVMSMPSGQNTKRRAGTHQVVSDACYQQLIVDRMQQTIAFDIAAALRGSTDNPITICPQPLPCVSVLDENSKWPGFRNAVQTGDAVPLAQFYKTGITRAFDGIADVSLQPEDTVTHDVCTDLQHTQGSIRLARNRHAHPESDVHHGNAAYGRKVLEMLLNDATRLEQQQAAAIA